MVVHMRISNVQTRQLNKLNVSRYIYLFQNVTKLSTRKYLQKFLISSSTFCWCEDRDRKVEAPASSHRVNPRLSYNGQSGFLALASSQIYWDITLCLYPLFWNAKWPVAAFTYCLVLSSWGMSLLFCFHASQTTQAEQAYEYFNPHSFVSSLDLCQKVTSISLNESIALTYLNICLCSGDWRGLCYTHWDNYQTYLLPYCVLWWLKRRVRSNWKSKGKAVITVGPLITLLHSICNYGYKM